MVLFILVVVVTGHGVVCGGGCGGGGGPGRLVSLGGFVCPINTIRSLYPQNLPEKINPEHL